MSKKNTLRVEKRKKGKKNNKREKRREVHLLPNSSVPKLLGRHTESHYIRTDVKELSLKGGCGILWFPKHPGNSGRPAAEANKNGTEAERKIIPIMSPSCNEQPPITGVRPIIGDGPEKPHRNLCIPQGSETLLPYTAGSHPIADKPT
ncbi:hypothetical protein AVEN_122902-1 [Araneus ventricosus]|uniref:Uncharacterized protein n=1 Tax=Araneus ventricosus TaxID=182803 RepID=A0A4Y2T6G8_ARAVE|nr:hypothetical protein AVEN_122902-1 [Araneus ventricosus]